MRLSLGKMRTQMRIPARQGRAFHLAQGEYLRLIDVEGRQVADFLAYVAGDPGEWLSPSHTRAGLGRLFPTVGQTLLSNRRRPLLTLVADSVGRHDTLYPPCDAVRYSRDFGVAGHANCETNLRTALAAAGIALQWVPDVFNFFMNTVYTAEGGLEIAAPLSGPGDHVLLAAAADLIVAVSACPQDLNACNGFAPSDLHVEIYPAAEVVLTHG